MPKRKAGSRKKSSRGGRRPEEVEAVGLRIVGGTFRGRRLTYGGNTRVRPMKDRTREAVFNLIGPEIRGKHAVDLFAGTGALALEALSRGASGATLIEQHLPTAKNIRENVDVLGVQSLCEIVSGDVFLWWKRGPRLPETPWVVFCSPPYRLFVDAEADMLALIEGMAEAAPSDSLFVVESDERFDFQRLPNADDWRCRIYYPAHVGVWRKP